jgi:hypothetical protein
MATLVGSHPRPASVEFGPSATARRSHGIENEISRDGQAGT